MPPELAHHALHPLHHELSPLSAHPLHNPFMLDPRLNAAMTPGLAQGYPGVASLYPGYPTPSPFDHLLDPMLYPGPVPGMFPHPLMYGAKTTPLYPPTPHIALHAPPSFHPNP